MMFVQIKKKKKSTLSVYGCRFVVLCVDNAPLCTIQTTIWLPTVVMPPCSFVFGRACVLFNSLQLLLLVFHRLKMHSLWKTRNTISQQSWAAAMSFLLHCCVHFCGTSMISSQHTVISVHQKLIKSVMVTLQTFLHSSWPNVNQNLLFLILFVFTSLFWMSLQDHHHYELLCFTSQHIKPAWWPFLKLLPVCCDRSASIHYGLDTAAVLLQALLPVVHPLSWRRYDPLRSPHPNKYIWSSLAIAMSALWGCELNANVNIPSSPSYFSVFDWFDFLFLCYN